MRLFAILLVLLVIVAGIFGPQFFFVVDETQAAIVTRFGEPRRTITEPGLKVKTPFVDTVTYFDKRNTLFDAPPDSLLTSDKKRLLVDAYAVVRISDALEFFMTVRTPQRAVTRGTDIISSELRKEIARDEQSEIIKTLRGEIMGQVTVASTPLLREFGLTIIDVRTKRIDFPAEIANSIYERMKAERKRIADGERAAGAQRDLEIRAQTDRDATIIKAEAERDANILRGEGEAEAVKIFADALNQGPEFYSFRRSLEAYRKGLQDGTTLVLSADSELFQFLQSPLGNGFESQFGGGEDFGLASDDMLVKADTAARGHLSVTHGVSAGDLTLRVAERTEWQDASLGCPQAGMMYAQVLTPAWTLTYAAPTGVSYEVRASEDGSSVASCTS